MRAAIIAFIVLAGSVGFGSARAAQLGIYAGISYAMVEKDSNRAAFENEALRVYDAFGFTPTSTSASLDSKDSSYGFVVGWRLTEHIALEGGYLDLGDVVYKDRSAGVSFSLAEIYNIRLEYGRVFDAGDAKVVDEADVDMATLNVSVSF